MIYEVYIKPLPNQNILTITLNMILNEINIEDENFNWAIQYLEASGHLGRNESIPELEEKINNSSTGFLLDLKNLIELSSKFDDIIDIVIIASSKNQIIRKYDDDNEMYMNYPLVIELIDSSYWLIHFHDKHLISDLLKKINTDESNIDIREYNE